jgi:transcriptional regulator with XRE-family HTH domain
MIQTINTSRQLGATIRSRRKEARLTNAQVAAFAKVSRRLLTEVEGGKRPNVGFSALIRILEVLGLNLEVRARTLPGTLVADGQ